MSTFVERPIVVYAFAVQCVRGCSMNISVPFPLHPLTHTPTHSLCQAEMAKRTATYTKLVLSLKVWHCVLSFVINVHPHLIRVKTLSLFPMCVQYPDGSVDTPLADEYSCTIGQLPLPSDYALVEYRTLIQPCLNELAKCY